MADRPDTPDETEDDDWGTPPPDALEVSDQRWEEKWSAKEDEALPPPARPLPPAPSVSDAYNEGMREAGPYLGLGLQIAGAMALFTGLGYVADRQFGTSPWGIIVGAALAFVAILALVVRLSNEANAKKKR